MKRTRTDCYTILEGEDEEEGDENEKKKGLIWFFDYIFCCGFLTR
jgi:hypothetical protein